MIVWDDGEAGGIRVMEAGVGLCGIIAVFDKGNRLTAPVRFSTLTSSFLSGGFWGTRTTGHVEGAGTETTRVLGVRFGSMRAALETGELSSVFVHLLKFISSFTVDDSFTSRTSTRLGKTGTKLEQLDAPV